MMYLSRGHGYMSVQLTLKFSSQSVIIMYPLRGHGYMSVQLTLQFSSHSVIKMYF